MLVAVTCDTGVFELVTPPLPDSWLADLLFSKCLTGNFKISKIPNPNEHAHNQSQNFCFEGFVLKMGNLTNRRLLSMGLYCNRQ